MLGAHRGVGLCALVSCALACGDTEPSAAEGTTGGAQTSSSSSTGPGTTGEGSTTDEPAGSSSSTGEGDSSTGPAPLVPTDMLLMESVVFYDGYAETVDEPVAEGIVRLNNAVQAVKLTEAQLDAIQPNLQMQVLIGALCDNYDRLGGVNVAFTPKGADTYDLADTPRIEIARFITPFMNMNREPDTVPYEWDIGEVATILRNPTVRETYDIWFELDVFGVPYAANTEISGCADRNDVFRGWLALYTDSTEPADPMALFEPLAVKETFNDYQEGASDALGLTRKTLEFTLEADTDFARLVLVTSNHGANAGGEEYIRRAHFVDLDGERVLEYRPGRDTCEPFRMYNTQGNGIYGPSPMTDEEWQSFSNWCPGDVIDTRIIEPGPLDAGPHTFVIDVPDAEFADDQGDFPFSLYLLAR